MNVFAKFDEIPSMIFQDIKETQFAGGIKIKPWHAFNLIRLSLMCLGGP